MKTRKPVLSDSFHSKLAAYSVTATAVLTLVPDAGADVQNITTFSYDNGATFVTTAPDAVGTPGGVNANVGFIETGVHGGLFNFYALHLTAQSLASIFISQGNNMQIALASLGNAARLNAGSAVAGKLFHAGSPYNLLARQKSGAVTGHFLPAPGANHVLTGYVGFKEGGSGHTYYGWLRVQISNGADGFLSEVKLEDKGGNGIFGAVGLPGDNITIGEPAPEPSPLAIGGLGLLALGARGVREMRRRRKAEKGAEVYSKV